MRQCVLLVGHGSREVSGNREIEKFVSLWRETQPDWRIELCFIEFAEVLLDQGLANAANNADRVIVVPLILNAAGHVKMEIPHHIELARQRFPYTEFLYAPAIGVNDGILSVMKRQWRQAMQQLDMPDPRNTGIILLARGSSDRQANGEVAKLARWLYEESGCEMVDLAFTGIAHPRLESMVHKQVRLDMRQIVVLPYYLFTGTLMLRIGRQLSHLRQQYPHTRFASGNYFGFEQEIFELISWRVEQTTNADKTHDCDGCSFREFAQQQGLGHSHEHADSHEHAHSHEHSHKHHQAQSAGLD